MYFTKVKSNIKGGCDTEIGRLTLIVGPNGSGKSRVVNSLELAASAEASDIVGRARVKKGIDLLALAPPEEALFAEATTNTGATCSLTIGRAGAGKGKAPQHEPLREAVKYPVREVTEILTGDVKKARDFVLNSVDLKITPKLILKALGPELEEPYKLFAAKFPNLAGVPLLQAVRDDAEATARAEKANAKKLQTVVDTLAGSIVEPISDDALAALKAERDAAHLAYQEAIKQPEVVDLGALKAATLAAVQAFKAAQTAADSAASRLGEKPKAVSPLITNLSHLLSSYAQRADVAPCVLCQEGRVNPETAATRLNGIREGVEAVQTWERKQAEAHRLAHQAAQLRARAASLAQKYDDEKDKEHGNSAERQEAIAAAYAKMTDAENKHTEAIRRQAHWDALDKARLKVQEASTAAALADRLAEGLVKLLKAVIKRAQTVFVEKVQVYLPPGDQFDLVLQDGKREVCQFGFRRDGVLHTALSGAEWARLTIALAATSIKEGDLALLIPEERAFDPEGLTALLVALQNAPGQVILTSPVGPTHWPEGWTRIVYGPETAREE